MACKCENYNRNTIKFCKPVNFKRKIINGGWFDEKWTDAYYFERDWFDKNWIHKYKLNI